MTTAERDEPLCGDCGGSGFYPKHLPPPPDSLFYAYDGCPPCPGCDGHGRPRPLDDELLGIR